MRRQPWDAGSSVTMVIPLKREAPGGNGGGW